MGAITTTGSIRSGEHSKGRFRLPLLGLLALLGPFAFDLRVGLLSGLYSLILIGYALWALRLTVVFRDDAGLGYLLALFDVALTLPLVLWGRPSWALAPLVGAWVAGLTASIVIRTSEERRMAQRDVLDPPARLSGPSCVPRSSG